jgi:Zn-dependent peptidase ImmA (M78 family)
VFQVEGIPVCKQPDNMPNLKQYPVACAMQLLHQPIIVIDDDFDKIAKINSAAADFVLAHEIGHIKLGHCKGAFIKKLLCIKNKRNLQQEIDADTFAMTQFSHICPYDAIAFTHIVKKGLIEEERIDNMYMMYADQHR